MDQTTCAHCGSLNGGHTLACQSIHAETDKPAQVPMTTPQDPTPAASGLVDDHVRRLVTLGDSLPKAENWDDYRLALAAAIEALAAQPAPLTDECSAISTGHYFSNCGPKGEIQCRYCGEPPAQPAPGVGGEVSDAAVEVVASRLYRRDWAGEFEQPKKRWRAKVRDALEAAALSTRPAESVAQGGEEYISRDETIFIGQTCHFGDEWFRELTLDGVKFLAPLDEQQHAMHLLATKNPIKPKAPTPATGSGGEVGFYLASFRESGSRGGEVLWWAPNNAGYTPDLEQAGIYTELKPGYHDSEHTVPVPVSLIRELRVRRTVDPGDTLNGMFWTAEKLRAAIAARPAPAGGGAGGA